MKESSLLQFSQVPNSGFYDALSQAKPILFMNKVPNERLDHSADINVVKEFVTTLNDESILHPFF